MVNGSAEGIELQKEQDKNAKDDTLDKDNGDSQKVEEHNFYEF